VPRFMDYHDYLNLPAEANAQMALKMSPGYIRRPPDVGVGQPREHMHSNESHSCPGVNHK